jgi:hypothetical protein
MITSTPSSKRLRTLYRRVQMAAQPLINTRAEASESNDFNRKILFRTLYGSNRFTLLFFQGTNTAFERRNNGGDGFYQV